jgi:hypothetical protein
MKNFYKHSYPNAWRDWYYFSKKENIEFSEFDRWCSTKEISVGIVEYPEHYSVRTDRSGEGSEFGFFETWFDALDAIAVHVFSIIEKEHIEAEKMSDIYRASKLLDTDRVDKEGVIKHYRTLIVEMGESIQGLLYRVVNEDDLSDEDLDRLDEIIMISFTCKRLISE